MMSFTENAMLCRAVVSLIFIPYGIAARRPVTMCLYTIPGRYVDYES